MSIRKASRHTLLMRLIVSSCIVILITALLTYVFSAYRNTEEMRQQRLQQSDEVCRSVVAQFENCLSAIRQIDNRIACNTTFFSSSNLSVISKERELKEVLGNLTTVQPFLSNVGYCMADDSNRVYTPTGKYALDTFSYYVLKMDVDELSRIIASARGDYYIPWTSESKFSALIIPSSIYNGSGVRNTACGVYIFSQESLGEYLRASLPVGYRISEICTPDNQILYRNTSSPIETGVSYDSIAELEGSDEKYYVNWAKGAKGFSCVTYVSETTLSQSLSSLSDIFLSMTFFACVICVLLVCILAVVNYLPLRALVRRVTGTNQRKYKNELDAIYSAFSENEEERLQLQEKIEQQKLTLLDYAYSRLISGGKLTEESRALLEEQRSKCYSLAVYRLSDIDDMDAILGLNRIDSSAYALEMYRMGYLVIILRDSVLPEEIRLICRDAQCVLSEPTGDINELHKQYDEAIASLTGNAETLYTPENDDEIQSATTMKLVEYVDAHFADADFCVSSTADYLGISEYSTGKLLREVYGANFRRALNEKRIALSKSLLMTTDEPISEVGKRCGFMSTSYFIKVFRDSENLTPAQFRQIAAE